MADPLYRADVGALADELRRAHGNGALDVAVQTAKKHLAAAAWKHCALWLQVVNRLSAQLDPSSGVCATASH
jgi:hypothetical protein